MEVIKEGTYTYLLKQIEYRTPVYDESVVHTQNESWDYYLSVEYEILKRNELKTLVSAHKNIGNTNDASTVTDARQEPKQDALFLL